MIENCIQKLILFMLGVLLLVLSLIIFDSLLAQNIGLIEPIFFVIGCACLWLSMIAFSQLNS